MSENIEVLAPAIELHHGLFDNHQEIVDAALLSDKWRPSTIFGNNGATLDKEFRNCKILDMYYDLNGSVENYIIAKTIFDAARKYSIRNHVNFSSMEPLQMLHYEAGEGFYRMHSDDIPNKPRIFSAILYLNDVDQGGETCFPNFNISIKPRAGVLALFPANYAYEHEARPPISNEKFSIVTWFSPFYQNNN